MTKNCLTFPWRDISGNLVNIKIRNLDWTPDKGIAKYMPLKIGNTWYKNKVSLMLYGIYQFKDQMQTLRQVFIFEGEKSVLKMYDYFDGIMPAVAVGGQTIHTEQIKQLIQAGVSTVYLCFDKDYDESEIEQKKNIFNLMVKKGEQLKAYFDVYLIFDLQNLLNKKDSPIDKGKDIFMKLWKDKIKL